jgi:transposase
MICIVDGIALKNMLDRGLSLAEIGRRVGRHEATVAYWVSKHGKHGLVAANRERNTVKGALDKDVLVALVGEGLSTAEIAKSVDRSKTTVRHRLREYGLQTQWDARRQASREGVPRLLLCCPHHGTRAHGRRKAGGYRCTKCRAEAVSRRRRRVKRQLVEEAGGACVLCGYDRYVGALEFHHLVRSEKSFAMSRRGVARSMSKARAEARKCVLLCANCHAEVEAGLVTVTTPHGAGLQCSGTLVDPG